MSQRRKKTILKSEISNFLSQTRSNIIFILFERQMIVSQHISLKPGCSTRKWRFKRHWPLEGYAQSLAPRELTYKSGLLVICLTFLNAWKQMLSVGKHFSEKKVHAYFTCSKFSEIGKSSELMNS